MINTASDPFIPFGSSSIKTATGPRRSFLFVITTGGTPCDDVFSLGGVPLSVSRLGEAYLLNVIQESGFFDQGEQTVIKGNTYKLLERGGIYSVEAKSGSGSIIPAFSTTFMGVPLALNENREFIVNEITPSVVDEYATTKWGGMPVMLGRVGNKWHLIMPSA